MDTQKMCNMLKPIWQKIMDMEDAGPFATPVDHVALQIPDYPKVIKDPMDLSTIKDKLESGQYTDPWDFIDDMWLMFRNAWTYNRRMSRVYRCCSKIKEKFEELIGPAMKSEGYCCGESRVFNPLPIACWGKPCCSITVGSIYWMYEQKVDGMAALAGV